MYEMRFMQTFSRMPVFTVSDANQIINNRQYAKKFLKKQIENGTIFRVRKNTYTVHKDPFLISTFLAKPSYISSVSALSYRKQITQIPNEVFCATGKKGWKIRLFGEVNFFHTNWFFGFVPENYEGFRIMVAETEKAIIDSFSLVPVSVFEEAFEFVDERKMVQCLRKIKKSSIVKRVGYLMEENGFNVYEQLKDLINYKYIGLDPIIKPKGKKDRKWGIIINTV